MHFAKSSAAGKRTRPRTPRSPAQGGGGTRTFPCGRQETAACCTAAGGVTGLRGHSRAGGRGLPPLPLEATHGHTFYIFYILYTVKFISRREASQSCQSCLKFLLHVLLISTANIDRSPSPICILYIFYTVPPLTSPLQFYTSTRPIPVRAAEDCRPYRWRRHTATHSTYSTFSTRLIPIPHLCVLRVFA